MNNYEKKYSLEEPKLNIDVKDGSYISSSVKPSLVFGLVSAVCSLVFPTVASGSQFAEFLSWIVCMICASCIVICAKRFLIMVVAAVFASLVISFAGSTIPVALMLGSLCAIALGSAAISRKKSSVILSALFIVIPAYALSLLITKDPIISLAALLPMPAAITLGIINRKKLSKSSAVVGGTVAAMITALAIMAVMIAADYGTLTVDTVKIAASDLEFTVKNYLEASIIAAGNKVSPELSRQITSFTDNFINLLPGAVVASAFTAVYICQSISLAVSERMGEDIKSRGAMSASSVTAMVFLSAYIISFSTSASGEVAFAAVVANNIAIMLTPCLFIIGLRSLKLMPYKLGLIGLILSGAVFIIMFLSSSSAFTVLALTGAVYTVIVSIDAWAKEHYSKGESK